MLTTLNLLFWHNLCRLIIKSVLPSLFLNNEQNTSRANKKVRLISVVQKNKIFWLNNCYAKWRVTRKIQFFL